MNNYLGRDSLIETGPPTQNNELAVIPNLPAKRH